MRKVRTFLSKNILSMKNVRGRGQRKSFQLQALSSLRAVVLRLRAAAAVRGCGCDGHGWRDTGSRYILQLLLVASSVPGALRGAALGVRSLARPGLRAGSGRAARGRAAEKNLMQLVCKLRPVHTRRRCMPRVGAGDRTASWCLGSASPMSRVFGTLGSASRRSGALEPAHFFSVARSPGRRRRPPSSPPSFMIRRSIPPLP